jgi:hypothetical protein
VSMAARRKRSPNRAGLIDALPHDLWMIILGFWFRGSWPVEAVERNPLLLPKMGVGFQRRFLAEHDLSAVTEGRRHMPVVYFAAVGGYVKIGTTRNIRSRMEHFYLGLEDVLAVVPGGRDLEAAYHDRFRHSRFDGDGRAELFYFDRDLRFFLWRLCAKRYGRDLKKRLAPVAADRMSDEDRVRRRGGRAGARHARVRARHVELRPLG